MLNADNETIMFCYITFGWAFTLLHTQHQQRMGEERFRVKTFTGYINTMNSERTHIGSFVIVPWPTSRLQTCIYTQYVAISSCAIVLNIIFLNIIWNCIWDVEHWVVQKSPSWIQNWRAVYTAVFHDSWRALYTISNNIFNIVMCSTYDKQCLWMFENSFLKQFV